MINIFDSLLLSKIIKDFQEGKSNESFEKLSLYIKDFPKDISAKYNFGLMAQKIGKIDIAIQNYKIVIRKNKLHWQSRNNLYLIYFEEKKYIDSLNLIEEVLDIKKNYQPVLRDKAHVLFYLKKLDLALEIIDKSLKYNPLDYIAINIKGMIYSGMRDYLKAKEIYLHAIKTNPQYHPSYSNLAKCLTELNERQSAIEYLQKCLKIKPNFFEALNNLANIYSTLGDNDKAIPIYLKLLNSNKNHYEINLNLANAYFLKKNIKVAKKYFKIVEELNPKDDKFKKNYGLFLLYTQDYKKAWQIGDGRLKLQEFYTSNSWMDRIKDKLWDGETININDTILVIKEQGVGDEILYSTIYPDLIKKYPQVKIETEKRLVDFFDKNFLTNNTFIPYLSISESKEKLKRFKYIIMAGSLGRLFRNSREDFPSSNYLDASKDIKLNIFEELNKISSKKKIGISWKSKREFFGEGKSLDLNSMAPLICNENFDFINMQYGDVKNEIIDFEKKFNRKIHTLNNLDLFNDFEKITALLQNLELFISISNSTAHVAGAANVKTWLIKPKSHAIFHYWNQPDNKTPWYPKIEIFEQYDDPIKLIKNLNEKLKEI